MQRTLVQPESGSIVHLEVGDTLEVRLVQGGRPAWSPELVPQGLSLVWDSAAGNETHSWIRTLVFRANFGVGGLLRLDRRGRTTGSGARVDLCVTVSGDDRHTVSVGGQSD